MLSDEVERFVSDFVKELEAGTVAVFAGSGLSVGAGFVDWAGLLQPIAKELGLDARKEEDNLVALAQYHVNQNSSNRSELHKRLLAEFPNERKPTLNHELIAKLPLQVIWTTNYDRLIEKAIEEAGKIPDVKFTTSQLAHSKPRRDTVVYKMHGDVEHPDQAVLTKDDYEKYFRERAQYITALSGDLVSRTFLFLGFSFKDPNLDYVLSRIRLNLERSGRRHYCVMKKVEAKEFDTNEAFVYAEVKQSLAIEDLKRFNIRTLLVDSFSQITEILARIEMDYRRRSVFISGSADEFGNWKTGDVEEFLADLGRVLVDRGYKVVTGFGKGLSVPLISGVTEKVYADRMGRIDDFLLVRPFPRQTAESDQGKHLWLRFRKDLLSRAGIAIFLFGNKTANGEIVPADGVHAEFEIAREIGLELIPVGGTGYVASELAKQQLSAVQERSIPYQDAFAALQVVPEKPQELMSKIIAILDALENQRRAS